MTPTIQRHDPAFPALANLRKSAEQAGNVRKAVTNRNAVRCERSARRTARCYLAGYAVRIGGTGAERAADAGSIWFGEPASTSQNAGRSLIGGA